MFIILWNWAGILVRALLRKKERAWIFTAAAAVPAAALVVWARTNP